MSINHHTQPRRTATAFAALLICTLVSVADADAPATWHEPNHAFRAEVRVDEMSSHADVDAAIVRLEHAGRMHPAADDVRIYNETGDRVPYQVSYHAPDRDALICFRTPTGEQAADATFWIYFGHADASRDPMRAVMDQAPGAGPPEPGPEAGGWVPRAGLVLETRRRPREADNPMDVEALAALINASPRADGGGLRPKIADAANPYGHSYFFISLYRGWIEIPEAGTWAFCTISNDGSFSFLNGEELIHWPGRHTTERGRRGEYHVERELQPGRYYIEYYHEDTSLHQMAYLGYRPPGQPHFVEMPASMFVQPHRAHVQRYEHRDHGRTAMPRAELIDSVWPSDRAEGQYTRYRLVADAGAAPIDSERWQVRWTTGDGQRHEGATVEHVYLTEGGHELTMTATHPDGWEASATRPLYVYPLEHMRDDVRVGRYDEFLPIVRGYELSALPHAALAQVTHFFEEAGAPAVAREAGALYVDRHGESGRDQEATAVDTGAAMRLAAAGAAGDEVTLWRGPVQDADAAANAAAHLEAALDASDGPAAQLSVLARLIRHEGIGREDHAAAKAHYEQAHALIEEHGPGGDRRNPLRRVEMAMGDVHLHHHRFVAAREAYLAAERLSEPRVPRQVRMVQVGAYPERMAQHFRSERFNEASDEVRRWRDRFPASLVDGELPYWFGRVYLARSEPAKAINAFELALARGQGMPFEAEAYYRLSEAHAALGDTSAEQRKLMELLATGLAGEFREKAQQRLDELSNESSSESQQ